MTSCLGGCSNHLLCPRRHCPYLIAELTNEADGVPLQVEAAVSETLPVSVLLGTDVPEFGGLLGKEVVRTSATQEADALVVTTRAQARRRVDDEDLQLRRQQKSGVRVGPVEEAGRVTGSGREPELDDAVGLPQRPTAEEVSEDWVIGPEFADDIFATGHGRVRLSRSEKRAARLQYSSEQEGTDAPKPVPPHAVDVPAEEFQRLQAGDMMLEASRLAADGKPSSAGTGFLWKDGLLYRRWQPAGRSTDMTVEQLVLPLTCRQTVLQHHSTCRSPWA